VSEVHCSRVTSAEDEAAFAAVSRTDGNALPANLDGFERMVAFKGDIPAARCTCTTVSDLVGAPGRSGLIGHFESLDAHAGIALLDFTARELARRAVQRILGPMNGNTWASYRLALAAQPCDPQGNPPFFLGEPRNPFEYPAQFIKAGFAECAWYESRSYAISPGELVDDPSSPASIVQRGLVIETLDPSRFEETLIEVYGLSLEAFADNAYYAPIGAQEFMAAYQPLRPLFDPRLVLLVRDADGALVSFLLTYPDPLWMPQGKPVRAVIKTIATASRLRGVGIARYLLMLIRARAAALGFSEVIHALMHVENTSMRLSGEQLSVLFRRYALFEWRP